jgi:enoyl-CoA hydratase
MIVPHVLSHVKRYRFVQQFSVSTVGSNVDLVKYETRDNVATIIINRFDVKNAIDRDTADALASALRRFDCDSSVKAGVLYGNGGTFCSGADLKAIYSGKYNRLEDDGDAPLGPSRLELSKPLIAAISGYAVAGGLELACLCDLRVMEDDAILGVFCRRWGVPLIDGGTVRLPRLIGLSRAMDLVLTGRPVNAKEAFEIGLANRIVSKGKARETAEQLAKEIISFPYECMLADRKSLYENLYDSSHKTFQDKLKNEFKRGKPIAQHMLKDGVTKFVNRKSSNAASSSSSSTASEKS